MIELNFFLKFLLAIALGALIGIERERNAKPENIFEFGGIRTFMFIALLGAISSYMASVTDDWIIAPIFIGFIFLLGLSYVSAVKYTKGRSIGLTGEIVAILTFFYGFVAMGENALYAVVLSILTTVFLYGKKQLHAFVKSLNKEEIYGAITFCILAFAILPFLPNETFGPLSVLNPYKIWLMVVFISGMGFVGYVLMRIFGSEKGVGLTGLLGGMVSSTATTLSFATASRSERREVLTHLFIFATIIANMVMYARVIIEVYVVNKDVLPTLIIPLIAMVLIMAVFAFYYWWMSRKLKKRSVDTTAAKPVEHSSPLSLGPALKFGALFAITLFVVKLAQTYFGSKGLYLASIVSGFVDVDAVVLSMANLAGAEITTGVASTAIILAVMSNTLIKYGYAAVFGSKQFRRGLGIAMAATVIVGVTAIIVMM